VNTSSLTPSTHRASLVLGDEESAKRAIDALTDTLFDGEAAVAASERPDGGWDVTVHFAKAPDQVLVGELLAKAVGADTARSICFDIVEPRDWVRASLEDLAPVTAGRFVVHGAHDRDRLPENKVCIEIEAALAFGTGHHGTTRGCLLLLDHVLKSRRPRRVLDLGAGTGVLAIAAAKAIKRGVLASDLDALSVNVGRENALLNGVGRFVRVIRAVGFSATDFSARGPFDLVLANILANPLRQLAGPMSHHLAPSALVVLSGLLTHQAPGVLAAYRERGLIPVKHLKIEGWSSLLLHHVR
jgi:ribosomal protein L11 methyltransferase